MTKDDAQIVTNITKLITDRLDVHSNQIEQLLKIVANLSNSIEKLELIQASARAKRISDIMGYR